MNKNVNRLKIALLGTRGIPAAYGGFETFAENLATRLVARGHEVTVYARRKFFQKKSNLDYKGVNVRYMPTVFHKYLETPVHALISFIDLYFRRCDVVLLCNAANSPFSWLVRLRALPLAINVDGIERNRTKWNAIGRAWYRLGELCSVLFASKVVADAEVIADYYRSRYHNKPVVIAYGAQAHFRSAGGALAKFGLKPKEYILYVARLEPENNALGVVQAYKRSNISVPLVIVGDAPYAKDYIGSVRAAADGADVIFTGYQFGDAYQEFQSNCLIYIQATEVGGTHPALIEAMAYGNAIVANQTPENMEVLGDAGEFYRKNDFLHLSEILVRLIDQPETISRYRKLAHDRAANLYNWEKITDQYEKLFLELAR